MKERKRLIALMIVATGSFWLVSAQDKTGDPTSTAVQQAGSAVASDSSAAPSAPLEPPNRPALNPLAQALFQEEANLNLQEAAQSYQRIIAGFDRQRPQAALAIFRLAEVYRKAGRLAEAKALYSRILREFPDQSELTQLSHPHLLPDPFNSGSTASGTAVEPPPGQFQQRLQAIVQRAPQNSLGLGPNSAPSNPSLSPSVRQSVDNSAADPASLSAANEHLDRQRTLLNQEIQMVEELGDMARKRYAAGAASQTDLLEIDRDRLSLLRQRAELDGDLDRQKSLLAEDIQIVEKMAEFNRRAFQNGKASRESVIDLERKTLELQRKLAELDSASPRRKSVPPASNQPAAGNFPLITDPTQAAADGKLSFNKGGPLDLSGSAFSPAESDSNLIDKILSDHALDYSSILHAIRQKAESASKDLELAQEEFRLSKALREAAGSARADRLPPPASDDARYREFKKKYETAVIDGTGEEAAQQLERILAWVQKIYQPELDSRYDFAARRLAIGESDYRDAAEQLAKVEAEKTRFLESYRGILENLLLMHKAKEAWKKQNPGKQADEKDFVGLLREGRPKSKAGETYQFNALGKSPAATLSEKLGSMNKGAVIRLPLDE